jgi:predicted phosphodiesterase
MSTLNFGPLEADTLLVFGGAYGNLEATQALLAKAKELGIAAEYMICTGDLAAYCADPADTARVIRRAGVRLIQGNCEQSLAAGADDCGCGFVGGTACEALSRSWFAYCQAQMDDATLAWFRSLPTEISFEFAGKRFLVVHGSPGQSSQFVFASTRKESFKSDVINANIDCIVGGHSGLPFTQIEEGLCWHNSGVIGMPANDGTSRVWYSLIHRSDQAITFEHRSLSYDAEQAHVKMAGSRLLQGYADCLLSGRWPSLDVLPELESSQAGRPLAEHLVEWVR